MSTWTRFYVVCCRRCGARVKQPCRSATGDRVAWVSPHADRVRVAEKTDRPGVGAQTHAQRRRTHHV